MALDENNRRYWVIEWLSRQGPPEWHGYSEKHNWDGSCAELHWIIQQPECDRATAANIFWLSEPSYYLDGSHDNDPVAQMDLDIVERWKGGFYRTSRFDFGGDYMDDHRTDIIETLKVGAHEIPASLADPIAGAEPFPSFSSGLPVEVDINWYNAINQEPPARFLARHGLSWDGTRVVGVPGSSDPGKMVAQRPGKLTSAELARFKKATSPGLLAKIGGLWRPKS